MYITVFWRFLSIVSGFIVLIILGKITTRDNFGEIQFIISIMNVCLLFTVFGNGSLVTRYSNGNDDENIYGIYILQLFLSLSSSIIVYFIFLNIVTFKNLNLLNIQYPSFIIILYSMIVLTAGNYRGKKIFYISQGIDVTCKSIIPLIFLLYAYLNDFKINVDAYLLVLLVSGNVYLLVFHRDLFRNLSGGFYKLSQGFLKTKQSLTKNLKETTALTATISVANSMRFIDIIMLGFLSSFIETANYKVCISLALLASVLFSAIGQFITPFLGKDRNKNIKFIKNITRLSFILTISSSCFLYLIAPLILKIFFEIDFEDVKTLVIILLFSNVVISFCGYTYEFCIMNELGTKMFIPALLIILLNVFLNFIFISAFQATGAALSTAICSVLFTVIIWHIIRRTFDANMNMI